MEEQKEPQTSNANTPSSNAAVPPPQSTTSISSTASTLQDVVMEDASSLSAAPTELISNNEKDSTEDTIELNKGNNQRIVEEFQYLLEKSQQLFAGLRDLPPTGGRQWQPYFQRTFEVYTKKTYKVVPDMEIEMFSQYKQQLDFLADKVCDKNKQNYDNLLYPKKESGPKMVTGNKKAQISQCHTNINLVLIQEVSKKQKVDYSTIISELIPLYGKINRLIPLYYIVTKNNDTAARNLINHEETSLLSSSSSSSSSSLSSLLSPKNSLSSPTKSTAALMNDQNDVNKREGDGDDNNDNNDEDDDEGENIYGLGFTTKLSSGAGALAKFLSLVEDDDSFGQLSSQVGDLFVPRKFSHNNNTNNLNKKENDDDGKN
ncbi:12132_t:CDS:2 [Entrophospora sp. SA101]|nr:12132_t:CDS:2 [Entrophospora sp. SA101]